MREFTLHTYDKSQSFGLNRTSTLAASPTGLGNAFDISYKDSDNGKFITNVKPNFDQIVLKVYFNADGSSGYANYKSFATFLARCGKGKFIFEYNDGVTDKYTDVILKSITKTEITDEGVFCETLTLERQTFWYETIDEDFIFEELEIEPVFPLSFPFGFQGSMFTTEKTLQNFFFESAPIYIKISGSITNNLSIYIKNDQNEKVAEIAISTDLPNGAKIEIDPQQKKIIIFYMDGTTANGYDLTDKTKQSFLYLPQGTYTLGANIIRGGNGKIEISIKRYLFD